MQEKNNFSKFDALPFVSSEGLSRIEKCEQDFSTPLSPITLSKVEGSKRAGWGLFVLLFGMGALYAENFFVAPKKKQSKLTVEKVCQNMMPENIISARINSLLGHNQAAGLSWIDDSMEEDKNALFNLATQEQLQIFNGAEQQYILELEHFEEVLQKRREFLKNWKQEVLTPKKK